MFSNPVSPTLLISLLVLLAMSPKVFAARTEPAINGLNQPASLNQQMAVAPALSSNLFQDLRITGGYKSYTDSARVYEYNDANGRQYRSKNEFSLGVRSKADWGVYGLLVQTALGFGDATKTRIGQNDPSLNIVHPLLSAADWRITGQYRHYFPVSDNSKRNSSQQVAYTSYLMARLAAANVLNNSITFRYNSQPKYSARDFVWYFEDYTTVTKQINPWLRMGVGQHTQLETHFAAPTGFTSEIYPLADFMLSPNIFVGPRMFLPIAARNTVGVQEAPIGVSTENIQFEFYLQATL